MQTVLLVSADTMLRELLTFVLEEEGYRVVQTDCPAGFVSLVTEERPKVAVVDPCLPGGSELLWGRDRTPAAHEIPVCLLPFGRGQRRAIIEDLDPTIESIRLLVRAPARSVPLRS